MGLDAALLLRLPFVPPTHPPLVMVMSSLTLAAALLLGRLRDARLGLGAHSYVHTFWVPHPSMEFQTICKWGRSKLSTAALIEATMMFISGREPLIQAPRDSAYSQVKACRTRLHGNEGSVSQAVQGI